MTEYRCRWHRVYVAMALTSGLVFYGGLGLILLRVITEPLAAVAIILIALVLYLSSLHGHGTFIAR